MSKANEGAVSKAPPPPDLSTGRQAPQKRRRKIKVLIYSTFPSFEKDYPLYTSQFFLDKQIVISGSERAKYE
jgi:hypothetical protein